MDRQSAAHVCMCVLLAVGQATGVAPWCIRVSLRVRARASGALVAPLLLDMLNEGYTVSSARRLTSSLDMYM